ncbi:MAG: signal recognition particle-docking protein FtsY [Candidatus Aenigmatarchaeota archaeon]
MFGILKKKISKAIEAISEKFKKKEEVSKRIEKKIEEMEKKEPEKVIEEIKKETQSEEVERILEESEKEIKEAKPKERKGLIKKVKEKIIKKIREKKLEEKDLLPVLNEMKFDLIEADVALEVAEKIINELKNSLLGKEIKKGEEGKIIKEALRKSLFEILSVPKISLEETIEKAKKENRPALFVFLGFNGVGKSLNLAKVALWLKNKGYKPLIAAGDTFRAAAIDQIEEYAKLVGAPVIKQKYGADSCAVIYDARKAASARGFDVVLADTAGRSHMNKNLMEELNKICRINKPDLKILVLDSLSGSDVINQFNFFDKAVGVDAVIFSKVDVNEKGGNILSVCYSFKKPILFIGIGQKPEDLMEYNPNFFVSNLLENNV